MADAEDLMRQIHFVDKREREYFHQAKLGQDTIDFLRSDVGKYLHGCAKQEIEILRDELEKVNPDSIWGRRKLRRLQKKAEAARFFMTWCAEAIQVGEVAYRELDEYRSEQ
jgi:hypothetical protein